MSAAQTTSGPAANRSPPDPLSDYCWVPLGCAVGAPSPSASDAVVQASAVPKVPPHGFLLVYDATRGMAAVAPC